jgi:hypothetical protein
MTRHDLIWRLAGSCALVAALVLLGKTAIAQASLPLLAQAFSWAAPDFHLVSLAVVNVGADQVVEVRVTWKHIQVIGSHVIYPDPRGIATASTLSAHILQGPGLAWVVAACWPFAMAARRGRIREWVLRGLALAPVTLLLVALDVPLTLAGELWSYVYDALQPGQTNVLTMFKAFLEGGGRYALGAAAGLIAVQFGRSTLSFGLGQAQRQAA